MKVTSYLLVLLMGVWFSFSIYGCASTAEQEDIYGEAIKETTEGIDTVQIATLSEENKALKSQISQLQSQNAQLQNEKADLEKKLRSLQETNTQLTAKISELGEQLEAERQKTRELSAKLSQYETQPVGGEVELKAEIAKRDSEIAEYKKQIRDLQAKLAELEVKASSQPATVAGEVKATYPTIIPETPTVKITEKEFRVYYNRGLNDFRNRKYQTAIAYFDTLLKSNVETNLKINAAYWIGESYFGLKQYEKAIEYFNYVAQTKSAKTPDALYMLGRCYAALGKIKEAKEYMNRVIKEYPKSPVAKKAKDRLERL
ncbi:tol-pal system protein YbgF [Candidatus Chrysopegis kryptomonas]|uniref:Tol-pal system protein YbgF n=1 Tax=Candidatus Chryseopegocella kryptomonas TaxID=1633643 RepID=A0A0P1MSU7_9BACT|nr:tol-pal system protein YbgF [Candidatus Chrysopegis kryptomonas]CUS98934.1 tol-pal system protein YbgF [Candidatus Chrysopegis kryptomonas]